ncbi:hypothetical protein NBRC116493_09010 [Aurantivibrio infirmus]
MSDQSEILTPESFQLIMAKMQVDFQKKIEALQAAGDYFEIAPASEQFKAEVEALTKQFQEDMGVPTAAQDSLAQQSIRDELDASPNDDECTMLMLLGAMYVEENNMLEHMLQLNSTEALTKNSKQILTNFFSTLDMNIEGVDPEEMKYLLSDSWGIETVESLKNMLAWLLKEGHNKSLMQLIGYCNNQTTAEARSIEDFRIRFDQPLAYEEYSEQEFKNTLILAENLQAKLPAAGIWAWDVARYVHLLRIGYMANYMTSNDCWVYLRRLLQPVSDRFESWEDYVHSFTQGYRWWSGTSGPIEDACHRLLKHPNSPWLYFGWFTPPKQMH